MEEAWQVVDGHAARSATTAARWMLFGLGFAGAVEMLPRFDGDG
jgi:hypothetical protein